MCVHWKCTAGMGKCASEGETGQGLGRRFSDCRLTGQYPAAGVAGASVVPQYAHLAVLHVCNINLLVIHALPALLYSYPPLRTRRPCGRRRGGTSTASRRCVRAKALRSERL